ncbi:MAG TPA: UDP-3-O-(3-hydroxymyristoyl)glucosamine N-acyltransferase [Phycisphaerae bacterium]|nr:UDP-3-O-(3-hydroxymyristoyl)glucosamine N-acyltransferase [Phycisphaerae bacterium]
MSPVRSKSFSVEEIASRCGATLAGNGDFALTIITRIAGLDEADEHSITWLANPKYAERLSHTRAGAIFGLEKLVGAHPRGLIVADPEAAIATLLEVFHEPLFAPATGIHPTAIVDPTARIGANVAVGAYTVIGPGTEIGDRSVIHEGVSIGREVDIRQDVVIHERSVIYDRCEIGNRVIIHAGVVIGCDGFGYIFRDNQHRKLMHVGSVIIEDDVEIGANSCVDRGKLGPTRVGRGTKIDNLVQIAHNVQLGPLCIVIAQTGIAGSVKAGTGVVFGGQAGVRDGVTLGDKAQVGARSGAMEDVAAGVTIVGNPGQPQTKAFREIVAIRDLPQLVKRVAALEKRVKELEAPADD